MGILTADMKRVVEEQKLGFVASVCPDGSPSLSPKGTTTVWDDDHLVFADICSPQTVANLRANPAVEINVVDAIVRKGYRFKGRATVLASGPQFDAIADFYLKRGSQNPINHYVLVKIETVSALLSPAYDLGLSEAEVAARWERHRDDLRAKRGG